MMNFILTNKTVSDAWQVYVSVESPPRRLITISYIYSTSIRVCRVTTKTVEYSLVCLQYKVDTQCIKYDFNLKFDVQL